VLATRTTAEAAKSATPTIGKHPFLFYAGGRLPQAAKPKNRNTAEGSIAPAAQVLTGAANHRPAHLPTVEALPRQQVLAKKRQQIGFSGHSRVLRWQPNPGQRT
jgi:hypothetical protein